MRASCRRLNLLLILTLLASVSAFAGQAGSGSFTVTLTDGYYYTDPAGNPSDVYSGSFSWNSLGKLTSFSFGFPYTPSGYPAWSGNLADSSCSNMVSLPPNPGIDICYFPSPVANPNAFEFFPNSVFRYGSTVVAGPNGGDCYCTAHGYVTWGSFNLDPVPEPSSLVMFGSGVLGLAGLLRRKFGA